MRFLKMLFVVVLISEVVSAQGGGEGPGGPGSALTCMIRIADSSCAQKYFSANAPANILCIGTCAANKCPVAMQHQYIDNAAWKEMVRQYRDVTPGEDGKYVAPDNPKICYSSAICKCTESPTGDGSCYADITNVMESTLAKFLPTNNDCQGM